MRRKILVLIIILCMGLLPRITLAETYDGEYSTEYLLKNYSLVTLGINDNYVTPENNKGNLYLVPEKGGNIEGAILINGNFTHGYSNRATYTFGTQAGNIKSFIKGTKTDDISTPSQLVTDSNYVDFNKMYNQVMSESLYLAENTQYHLNGTKMEVSKPGIYTIHNTARQYYNEFECNYGYGTNNNSIVISNYNKNDVYIFNYYNEYLDLDSIPNINIKENNNTVPLKDYMESGNYTGNIIFNFPNAISINLGFDFNALYYGCFPYMESTGVIGHIIAPKATINLYNNFSTRINYDYNSYYYGGIIANTININYNFYSYVTNIKNTKYTSNKKIINDDVNYTKTTIDYLDDYYTRDYSISDLLQNYSLITLGHKAIDSKSKLLEFGNVPGSMRMFHITGQALIAGNSYGKVYQNETDSYYTSTPKFDRTAFDLESNEVTESYIRGNVTTNINGSQYLNSVIQPWDNMTNDNYSFVYQKNNLFIGQQSNGALHNLGPGTYTGFVNNYINFDRLYNNIVAEQKEIEEGISITPSNGKAHIRVGGSYVIDNINDINEIIFDNFDDNKKYITVITIKNRGDINFPLISKDTGSYKGIVTNDYFGKEQATHLYEQDTFTQDTYFGNIVWNIPNATYIKLKEGAPFAGHLIAPNADVDTPETHFAGCFIVNSIYGEGNTEAHFYPLTATATYDVPEYDDLTSSELSNLSNMRLKRLLGGKGSQIETTVIGNEEEFRREEAKLNNIIGKEENNKNKVIPPIIDILQNPLTKRNIIIIISALIIISVVLGLTFKKKNKR